MSGSGGGWRMVAPSATETTSIYQRIWIEIKLNLELSPFDKYPVWMLYCIIGLDGCCLAVSPKTYTILQHAKRIAACMLLCTLFVEGNWELFMVVLQWLFQVRLNCGELLWAQCLTTKGIHSNRLESVLCYAGWEFIRIDWSTEIFIEQGNNIMSCPCSRVIAHTAE